MQGVTPQLGGVGGDIVQPLLSGSGHFVRRASTKGVVKLGAHECAPRGVEQRSAIATTRVSGERAQRLGDALEEQLDCAVVALERCARTVDALQRPGVAVRPAQLARNGASGCGLGSLEEFIEA